MPPPILREVNGGAQVTFDTYGHLFEQADKDSAVAEAIEKELLDDLDATQMQQIA